MKISNKGNAKIRYSASVQIIQGKQLIDEYSTAERVVAANGYYVDTQKIVTSNIKNSGEYTLRVVLSYFDENGKRKNIKKETNLVIKGNM